MVLTSPVIAPVTVAPTAEPLSVADVRDNLRIDHDYEDSRLSFLITMARELIEERCSIAIMEQTRQLHLDRFPDGDYLKIPYPPFMSLSSFTYRLDTEASRTVDSNSYSISSTRHPAILYLKDGYEWPTEELSPVDAVKLTYKCGYATAAAVPRRILQAMHLLIGHFYEHREEVVLGSVVGVKSGKIAEGAASILMQFRFSSF